MMSATGAALTLALSGAAVGQDASPSPAPEGSPGAQPGHPAHIHSGTCEQLGEIVFPLSNVSDQALINSEPGAGDQVGTAPAGASVMVSVTSIDAALGDIYGAEHAINVHQSQEDLGTYIACGNVSGTLVSDSALAVALEPLNDSGMAGVGWLAEGEEGTIVYLFLMDVQQMMGGAAPTPGESPMMSPAASPMAEVSPVAGETIEPQIGTDESPTAEGSPDIIIEVDIEDPEAEVVSTPEVVVEEPEAEVDVERPEESPAA